MDSGTNSKLSLPPRNSEMSQPRVGNPGVLCSILLFFKIADYFLSAEKNLILSSLLDESINSSFHTYVLSYLKNDISKAVEAYAKFLHSLMKPK